MKNNELKILIKKPSSVVFAYYTNPNNTPLWWDAVAKEETSEWPIKIGTTYRSHSGDENWSVFTVTNLKENEIFELTSKDGNYHVRYTHKIIDENTTELTYYEWMTDGNLDAPFTMKELENLKSAIESL